MNHDLNIVVGVTPQDVTNLDDGFFLCKSGLTKNNRGRKGVLQCLLRIFKPILCDFCLYVCNILHSSRISEKLTLRGLYSIQF